MNREDKKAATRQRISNIATTLFFERGFDAVTMQDIADAADVSKMTVHNYFARKEDLLLDRRGEATVLLTEAMASRPEDESVVQAIRALVRRLREENHPFVAPDPGRMKFWDIVAGSESLSSRARELGDEAVDECADVLARAVGAKAADGSARLIASTTLAIWRTAYTESIHVLRARGSKAKAHAAFDDIIDRGFAMLDAGMRDTPYGSG